jgi:hypothetical protein
MRQSKSERNAKIHTTEDLEPATSSVSGIKADQVTLSQIDDRNARLRLTIEAQIIPCLMLAYARDRRPNDSTIPTLIDEMDFTALIMIEDENAVLSHVDELQAKGLAAETICRELLEPAVRKLNKLLNEEFLYRSRVGKGLAHIDAVRARLKRRRIS